MPTILVILAAVLVPLCCGQLTNFGTRSCTYSFVVPSNHDDTCQGSAGSVTPQVVTDVDEMKRQMAFLRNQVQTMADRLAEVGSGSGGQGGEGPSTKRPLSKDVFTITGEYVENLNTVFIYMLLFLQQYQHKCLKWD